jgi:hypothetical protein
VGLREDDRLRHEAPTAGEGAAVRREREEQGRGLVGLDIERAIRAVEAAADEVGHVLAAPAGALLVTDNWHALHDRLPQCVEPGLPLRRSLLCFVETLDPFDAPRRER